MKQKGFNRDQLYLTATHTHNGFGNWDRSKAGSFIFGGYNEAAWDITASGYVSGLTENYQIVLYRGPRNQKYTQKFEGLPTEPGS